VADVVNGKEVGKLVSTFEVITLAGVAIPEIFFAVGDVVVVSLGAGDEVARFLQGVVEGSEGRGDLVEAAHVVGARSGGVGAEQEGAARRGTDGCVGKAVGVALALGGELVEVGSVGVFVTVATQVEPVVLGEDEGDVRFIGACPPFGSPLLRKSRKGEE
jgi:hypothetical protein